MNDVAELLRSTDLDVPAGSFKSNDQMLLVRADASVWRPADIERLRGAYGSSFSNRLSTPPKPISIDKYPLLLIWAPIIRSLWPIARFILALRDPRDVRHVASSIGG